MDTTFWRSSGPLMTLWIPGSHICRFSHQQIVNVVHDEYTVGWGWSRCGIGRYRKVRLLVAQSRLTLCNPTNCSPPGSSVHGILQARMLEWVAIPFFRSSWPRNGSGVCCIAGRFLTIWATGEAQDPSYLEIRGQCHKQWSVQGVEATQMESQFCHFVMWDFGQVM